MSTKKTRVEKLKERLANYPGPHKNETWKLETDLTKCTMREMRKMQELGVTPGQLMAAGLNRGEVHHILYGYMYSVGKVGKRDAS